MNQLKNTSRQSEASAESLDQEHPNPEARSKQGKRPLLAGQRFGRWTLLAPTSPSRNNQKQWICRCECGSEKAVLEGNMKTGKTVSCGCFRTESQALRITHGKSKSREYKTWSHVIDRCVNPNSKNYIHYGGRGIAMCERWRNSFQAFLDDMGERPHGTEIERIDNEKGYFPDNCRWATRLEQMQNTRLTRNLTMNGVTKCLSQWARDIGISNATLIERLLRWPENIALSKAPRRRIKTINP